MTSAPVTCNWLKCHGWLMVMMNATSQSCKDCVSSVALCMTNFTRAHTLVFEWDSSENHKKKDDHWLWPYSWTDIVVIDVMLRTDCCIYNAGNRHQRLCRVCLRQWNERVTFLTGCWESPAHKPHSKTMRARCSQQWAKSPSKHPNRTNNDDTSAWII